MKNQKRAFAQRRRGAAAVEMALVTPLFLMIVFAIIEFGRALMASNMVTSAAREGARLAVMDGATNASVTSAIKTFMTSTLGKAGSSATIAITTVPATGNPDPANVLAKCNQGDLITIQVQVPFNNVALIPGNYLGGKQLIGQCAMSHE